MRRNVRIAMISEHASPMALLGGEDAGGQNVYVDELSGALAAYGYDVDVFVRRDNAEAAEFNQWRERVRVINLTAGPPLFVKKDLLWPYMPKLRDSFLRFTKIHSLDYALIHANFWMSGWVACELKHVLGIPVVQTFHALGVVKKVHQGKADTSPKQRLGIERKVVNEVDTVVATCPAEKEDLLKHYHADDRRISIIPCGVNTSVFFPIDKAEARQHLGVKQDESVIVYVGRVLPRKGIDNVIEAVAQLKKASDLPVRLIVVGGENETPFLENDAELHRLEALSRSAGIRDLVIFTGKRPQEALRFYYSAADVCVTTPWYEPFGMVPLESMACGTPVIASGVGGLTYTVLDGVTGFLVPPKDPEALAGKLEYVLSSPQLRHQLADRAVERVAKFFTWPRVSARMAGLYESLTTVNREVEASDDATRLLSPASLDLEPDYLGPQ